jgi:hypothetical protein
MAENFDEDRTLPNGGRGLNRTPETDPEHLLAAHTHAAPVGSIGAESRLPDAVRDDIQRTRARMSSTIDEIEGALLRKKAEVKDRLDFIAPVRNSPWLYSAGVFGSALALGWLTGGGDDDEQVKVPRSLLASLGAGEAGEGGSRGERQWEERSRELMRMVARQGEELRSLRQAVYQEGGASGGTGARGLYRDDWDDVPHAPASNAGYDDELEDDDDDGIHIGAPLAGVVSAGVAAAVGGMATRLLRRRRGKQEMDVEVELEAPRDGGSVPRLETRPWQDEGDDADLDLDAPRRHGKRLTPLAGAVAGVSAAVVGGLVNRLMRSRGPREQEDLEVEVELERERTSPRAYPPELAARGTAERLADGPDPDRDEPAVRAYPPELAPRDDDERGTSLRDQRPPAGEGTPMM